MNASIENKATEILTNETVKDTFALSKEVVHQMTDERIRIETTDYLNGFVDLLASEEGERLAVGTTEAVINWLAKGDNAEKAARAYSKIIKAVTDVGLKNAISLFIIKGKVEKAYGIIEETVEECSETFTDLQKAVTESNEELRQIKKGLEETDKLKDEIEDLKASIAELKKAK